MESLTTAVNRCRESQEIPANHDGFLAIAEQLRRLHDTIKAGGKEYTQPDARRRLDLLLNVRCVSCSALLHPFLARNPKPPVNDIIDVCVEHGRLDPAWEPGTLSVMLCVWLIACASLSCTVALSVTGVLAAAVFIFFTRFVLGVCWRSRWAGTYRCHVCWPAQNVLDRVLHGVLLPKGTGWDV